MSKYLSLILVIILAVTSLLMAMPTDAQTIPKPAIPEFTVKLVSHPYDVPTTTTTTVNPYTGEQSVITHPGYHVENRSIEITIKNQPFTAQLINSSTVQMYYNVRYKGHYSVSGWMNCYNFDNHMPTQSSSQYTVLTPLVDYPQNGTMDFQVKAILGDIHIVNARMWGGANYWEFVGVEGDWSPTQTLTIIPESTPTPNPSPTVPEFPIIASLVAVLAAVSLLLVIGKKKLQ